MSNQLHLVQIIVNSTRANITVNKFHYKSTPSGYIVAKKSNFGGDTTRVKLSQILVADSLMRDGHFESLQFYTWCHEQDIDEAKNVVKMAAKVKIIKIQSAGVALREEYDKIE